MFIFQRFLTLQGSPHARMTWAMAVAEFVNANTDREFSLWHGNFGYPLGTVAWTTRAESRAEVSATMGSLMANDSYRELVDSGMEFVAAPGSDQLLQLIHPESMPDSPPPVGAAVEVISAQPANGHMMDVIGWGIEIAGMHAELTGSHVGFYSDAYGDYSRVTWIATYTDVAAVDTANAVLRANSEYLASIDGSGHLFSTEPGSRALATRIA